MDTLDEEELENLGIKEDYVIEAYKNNELHLIDVINYSLWDKISIDKVRDEDKELIEIIGLENLKYIEKELINESMFRSIFLKKIKKNRDDFSNSDINNTQTVIEKFERESIIDCLNTFGFDYSEYFIFQKNETAKRIAGEYIIDFPDDENLKFRYFVTGLDLKDIFNNIEIFRGKKFCPQIYQLNPDITEDMIIYFYDNYKKISDIFERTNYRWGKKEFEDLLLCVDVTKTKEENDDSVNKKIKEKIEALILNKDSFKREPEKFKKMVFLYGDIIETKDFLELLKDVDFKTEYDDLSKIIESSSIESVDRYDIPKSKLLNSNYSLVFSYFGLDNIMQFDKENGNFFLGNNEYYLKLFSNLVYLTELYKWYNLKIGEKKSKEEFENIILDIFANGLEYDPRRSFDYKTIVEHNGFSDDFKERLIDKMLVKLLDLVNKGADLKESFSQKIKNVIKKFPLEYSDILFSASNVYELSDYDFKFDLSEEKLEKWYINKIKEAMKYRIISHREDVDERIKKAIPEFYLDESAPFDLKRKFYSKDTDVEEKFELYDPTVSYYKETEFQIEDFANLEFLKYIEGKDLSASNKDGVLNLLLEDFSKEELVNLIFNNEKEKEKVSSETTAYRINLLKQHCMRAKQLKRFKENYTSTSIILARKKFCENKGFDYSRFSEYELSDEELVELNKLIEIYKERIFNEPQMYYVPEEKNEEIDFDEFDEICKLTEGWYSSEYRKTTLWQMYGFLGYKNCKNLIQNYDENEVEPATVDIFGESRVYSNLFTKTFMKNKKEFFENPDYVRILIEELHKKPEKIDEFLENSEFKSFHSNFGEVINGGLLEFATNEEKRDFYKFAKILGCFSTKKILDKKGKETSVTMSQKASSVLAKIVNNSSLKVGEFHRIFDSLSPDGEFVDSEFLSFISISSKKGYYDNLELLMELEKEKPGIFEKVMTSFEEAKKCRNSQSKDGLPILLSWREALTAFYSTKRFSGVTKANSDIAKEFSKYPGISQDIFDLASSLRKEAIENDVPEHIVGKPIKEDSILASIEKIKNSTETELAKSEELIEDLYKKQFTYEWLSKRAPENGILGSIFCNCCANLKSAYYGRKIAINSITAKDVQNLVVRDNNGEIIGKCTLYANEELRYCVINDFEINDKYKKTEDRRTDAFGGRYSGDLKEESEKTPTEKVEDKNRALIFDAFIRGIMKFVEEYNLSHPDEPIEQINVGMGYNKLKKQTEMFEKATELLEVPAEYSFADAQLEQYVLYKRPKEADKDDIKDDKEDRDF